MTEFVDNKLHAGAIAIFAFAEAAKDSADRLRRWQELFFRKKLRQ